MKQSSIKGVLQRHIPQLMSISGVVGKGICDGFVLFERWNRFLEYTYKCYTKFLKFGKC